MDPIGKKRTAEVPVVPSSPSLAHDLEALRDCVLLRLETIEDLARRRCGSWSAEINRLEQALKERTEELEQERTVYSADSNGDDQSWRRMLSRLESDRKLLTEAWERLERERIDAVSAGPRSGARPKFISRAVARASLPQSSSGAATRGRCHRRDRKSCRGNNTPPVSSTMQGRPPHDGSPLRPPVRRCLDPCPSSFRLTGKFTAPTMPALPLAPLPDRP